MGKLITWALIGCGLDHMMLVHLKNLLFQSIEEVDLQFNSSIRVHAGQAGVRLKLLHNLHQN